MVNINNGKHWEMNKHEHIADIHTYITHAKTATQLTSSAIFFDHVPSCITNIPTTLSLAIVFQLFWLHRVLDKGSKNSIDYNEQQTVTL